VLDSLLLVLVAVVISVLGQLSLKVGMNQVGAIDAGSLARPIETLMRVLSTPLVRPEDVPTTMRVLSALGYETLPPLTYRNEVMLRKQGRVETVIEVH